ncbi:hypothetical protein [Rhizobium sp. No.120]
MQDYEAFFETYEGENTQEARDAYGFFRFRAEAGLDVISELGPHDTELALANAARELVCAEIIGYRLQALQRYPILEDAIFIMDVDHAEPNLTPGGSVSSRRDWMDREDTLVRAFLADRYRPLAQLIDDVEV